MNDQHELFANRSLLLKMRKDTNHTPQEPVAVFSKCTNEQCQRDLANQRKTIKTLTDENKQLSERIRAMGDNFNNFVLHTAMTLRLQSRLNPFGFSMNTNESPFFVDKSSSTAKPKLQQGRSMTREDTLNTPQSSLFQNVKEEPME